MDQFNNSQPADLLNTSCGSHHQINPFCHINYTSTTTHILIKYKVDTNPRHWKPLFCPIYEFSFPLAADQPSDKWK